MPITLYTIQPTVSVLGIAEGERNLYSERNEVALRPSSFYIFHFHK